MALPLATPIYGGGGGKGKGRERKGVGERGDGERVGKGKCLG